jgi:hypothetical protein
MILISAIIKDCTRNVSQCELVGLSCCKEFIVWSHVIGQVFTKRLQKLLHIGVKL